MDRRKAEFHRRLSGSSAARICVSSGLFENQNRYGPPMNADKRRWKKVIRQLA
jgi:hypothetical protein